MKFNFNSTHIRHKNHQQTVNEAFDFMSELEDSAEDSLNMQSTLKNQLRYENLISYLSRAIGKDVDYDYELAISSNDRDYGVFTVPGMNKCLGIKWVESEENIIEITWMAGSYKDREQNLQLLAYLLIYCDKYSIAIRNIKLTEWSVIEERYGIPLEPFIFTVEAVDQMQSIVNAINSAQMFSASADYSAREETGTINFNLSTITESDIKRATELMDSITQDNFTCTDIIVTIDNMTNLDSAVYIVNNGMDATSYFKSRHIRLPKPELVRDRIEMYKQRDDIQLASTADMNLTLSRMLMYIALDVMLFHEDSLVFGINGAYTNPKMINNSNRYNYASYNIKTKELLKKYNFTYQDFINMLQYLTGCKNG